MRPGSTTLKLTGLPRMSFYEAVGRCRTAARLMHIDDSRTSWDPRKMGLILLQTALTDIARGYRVDVAVISSEAADYGE